MPKNNKIKAFTLIELLVVIAVIALLTSIVLVALQGGREKANTAKTLEWARSVEAQLGGDMVGSWNFNEGTGTIAYDATGYNNGTLGNGLCTPGAGSCPSWTDGVQGLTGNALYFDGGDYVNVPTSASLNITDTITVELWTKPNRDYISEPDGWQGGWSQKASSWLFGWCGWQDGICYGVYKSDGSWGRSGQYTFPIYTGTWYHFAFTYDGRYVRGYANGVLKKTDDYGTIEQFKGSGSNVLLGTAVGGYFKGSIDEVRIYSRALTALEIQKHYAQGLPRHTLAEK